MAAERGGHFSILRYFCNNATATDDMAVIPARKAFPCLPT